MNFQGCWIQSGTWCHASELAMIMSYFTDIHNLFDFLPHYKNYGKNKWTIWQWTFKRTRRKEQITNNLMIILWKNEAFGKIKQEKNNEQFYTNNSK